MSNKRIGIITGGGDVPGLNTVSAIAPTRLQDRPADLHYAAVVQVGGL